MYQIKEVLLDSEREIVIDFLQKHHLEYEYDIDYSILVYDQDKVIATASIASSILKGFAVDKSYGGQNITGLMFHHLVEILQSRRIYHYFVYTSPENEEVFKSFHMKRVVCTMNTCLLEGGDDIHNVLKQMKTDYKISDHKKAAIVMNANPMTNGHLYLVEEAAKDYDEVLVFVVSEDASSFSFTDRFKIIKESTKHIKGVVVLPSLSYLVSKITFPKYFLKEDQLIKDEQTLIDVLVYKEYYKKIFHIDKRFLGSEPFSANTNKYNKVLKDHLGLHVKIIERKEKNHTAISASMVRRYLKAGHVDKVKDYVPKATYDYLLSKDGQAVIKDIQSKKLGRH
jgi:[citrate (pro-3S)-lyase] ligase